MERYHVIGLMSGTSLDGLDIAHCVFSLSKGRWAYEIRSAQTISYNKDWKKKLAGAHKLSSDKLAELDAELGRFIGGQVNTFIKKNRISKVDLISSHGHTIFHQPEKGFTLQIGNGAAIAALTGIKTVCDFRSGDVALGGQGAPLVPIGDLLLFSQYQACLNLGGIANISMAVSPLPLERDAGVRRAFDICPVNIVLNHLAGKKGLPYDKDGNLAAKGKVNWGLIKKLNALPFYNNYKSKSLGREWIEKNVLSLIEKEKLPLEDKLATASEHAAFQIARILNHYKIKNVLITGGGAYNSDLIKRISDFTPSDLLIPSDKTIQFKEALVFAFLGVLRLRGEVNCLKAVTGAKRDSVGGAVYNP